MSAQTTSVFARSRLCSLSLFAPAFVFLSFACLDLQVKPGDAPAPDETTGAVDKIKSGDFVTPDPDPEAMNEGSEDKAGSADGDDEEKDNESMEDEAEESGAKDKKKKKPKDSGADDEPGQNPGKILDEADVVHMQGDLAYVLSEYSGLHILDLSDPANIRIKGAMPMDGAPFEMYLRESELVVMVRDLHYFDPKDEAWKGASAVLRLDVKDPAAIKELSKTRILGRVSDSRMENDRLYVVSYEDGRCYDCDGEPKVRLSSLQAPKGGALSKIDEVSFAQEQRLWRPPSAYFGKDQIFIALPQRRNVGEKGQLKRAHYDSKTGDLEAFSPIDVDGRVQSRWQMNQKGKVLRVFSQSWKWNVPPKLETFELEKSDAKRLAGIDVKLPEPEDIKSARFDGDRAYLITFRRTDPLFTFDLGDPAKPKQLGELEIPGWIYHMEPRGDRLLGAGYNTRDPKNRLSLTLFDVSNLAEPKVLSRVDFGGLGADFSEGQDQIHKSIKLLKEKNLILVPYLDRYFGKGGDEDGDEDDSVKEESAESEASSESRLASRKRGGDDCGERTKSAVQLFDWNENELKVRGLAPVYGGAHRSFLHRDRLIALSDRAISAFNIDDRDNPKLLASEDIALDAQHLLMMGEHSVRVSRSNRGLGPRLEIVKKGGEDKVEVLSAIALGDLDDSGCSDGRYVRVHRLFAQGDNVYVIYRDRDTRWRNHRVAAVSLADPAKPKILGTTKVTRSQSEPNYRLGAMKVRSETIGAMGDRVVMASLRREWDRETHRSFLVTEFTVLRVEPGKGLVKELTLDRKNTRYAGGLVPAGNELGSWHARKTNVAGQLKFYYDRFYIDSAGRFNHKAINVPGVPLGRDSVHQRLLSMNFALEPVDLDPRSCKEHVKYHEWDWNKSRCLLLQTGLAQIELPETGPVKKLSETDLSGDKYRQRLVFLHDDRVFSTSVGRDSGGARVVAGLDAAATLRQARFESDQVPGDLSPLNDAQVMERINPKELRILDARNLEAVSQRSYEAPHRWCKSPQARDNQLQCALGRYGVRLIGPK